MIESYARYETVASPLREAAKKILANLYHTLLVEAHNDGHSIALQIVRRPGKAKIRYHEHTASPN